MKLDTIQKLGLVFVIMLLLIVGREYLKDREQNEEGLYEVKMEGKTVNPVSEVKIMGSKEGEELQFNKNDDKWFIGEDEVDIEAFKKVIDSFFEYDRVSLVAQTNKKHEELELTEEKCKKLTMKKGEEDYLNFCLGKQGMDGSYFRFKDEDEVFLNRELVRVISFEKDGWLKEDEATGSAEPSSSLE